MNSLFSQLNLGKRALFAQQSGMSVAGHNIANVNNENYTRQRLDLEEQHPRKSRFGMGVDVQGVSRMTDQFTTKRLIAEHAMQGSLQLREETYVRLERIFSEMEGNGLRQSMNEFWNSWADLSTQPESQVYRQELVSKSRGMTDKFQGISQDLIQSRRDLNGRISEKVERVNQLAMQLARQNEAVQQTDRGEGQANDLKDERERTLTELSKLVAIDWVENENKTIQVQMGGGWQLVNGRKSYKLEASYINEEAGMFSIRGLDAHGLSTDMTHALRAGEVGELVRLRDEVVAGYKKKLDTLASELAFKVNRLHAVGTGMDSSVQEMHSSFALKPEAQRMPLPFIKSGRFEAKLVDNDNHITKVISVNIEAGKDTLADIVAKMNQAAGENPNFSAKLNTDGSVTLESVKERFILGDDETEFGAVMGFNNFFETLKGAEDLRVSPRLVEEPLKISTGKNLIPGDNQVALAVHGLQFEPNMEGDTITFDEYYNGVLAQLGLETQRSQNDRKSQDLVVDQFQKIRHQMSSVNMDEEVADMVQYQRGYEAAAKFISTVDDMTKTVIHM
ncbi:MAG: flagellar hook-associated protein FlgK [Deltaproteobacteria bacterium]|nr:flagellar hook-associated protein FlgK [Deltaproteobacteria bacterium]